MNSNTPSAGEQAVHARLRADSVAPMRRKSVAAVAALYGSRARAHVPHESEEAHGKGVGGRDCAHPLTKASGQAVRELAESFVAELREAQTIEPEVRLVFLTLPHSDEDSLLESAHEFAREFRGVAFVTCLGRRKGRKHLHGFGLSKLTPDALARRWSELARTSADAKNVGPVRGANDSERTAELAKAVAYALCGTCNAPPSGRGLAERGFAAGVLAPAWSAFVNDPEHRPAPAPGRGLNPSACVAPSRACDAGDSDATAKTSHPSQVVAHARLCKCGCGQTVSGRANKFYVADHRKRAWRNRQPSQPSQPKVRGASLDEVRWVLRAALFDASLGVDENEIIESASDLLREARVFCGERPTSPARSGKGAR